MVNTEKRNYEREGMDEENEKSRIRGPHSTGEILMILIGSCLCVCTDAGDETHH